jgi:hypothetical protein
MIIRKMPPAKSAETAIQKETGLLAAYSMVSDLVRAALPVKASSIPIEKIRMPKMKSGIADSLRFTANELLI